MTEILAPRLSLRCRSLGMWGRNKLRADPRECMGFRARLQTSTAIGILALATPAMAQQIIIDPVENNVSPSTPTPPVWTIAGPLSVGIDSAGRLSILDGAIVNSQRGILGEQFGGQGTVIVSGSQGGTPSQWNVLGSGLDVGMEWKGTLQIDSGGKVVTAGITVGRYGFSTGTVSVSGTGSTLEASGEFYVGSDGGGTVSVIDGALVTVGGQMHVANSPTAAGSSVLVSGVDSLGQASRLHIDSMLNVGEFNEVFLQASVRVEDGGKLESNGGVIGRGGIPGLGNGIVTISGTDGGSNISTWENVGELIVSQEFLSSGQLNISGGGKVTNTNAVVGKESGANGQVTVTGTDGGSNLSTWINAGTLTVAEKGIGSVSIAAGGVVQSVDGVIGKEQNAFGAVTVSGTDGAGNVSTWRNSGNLVVGKGGNGTLEIRSGGKVTNVDGVIGGDVSGTGFVAVSGSDGAGNISTWQNSGRLSVGNDTWGRLEISDGGAVSSNGGVIGNGNILGEVTVQGTDGAGNISKWENSGDLTVGLSNGALGYLSINGGGKVTANTGVIATDSGAFGSVLVSGTDGAGNVSTWDLNSNLTVGRDGDANLVVEGGALVENRRGIVAHNAGTSTVRVSGSDGQGNVSTWRNSAALSVGFEGAGSLSILDGGRVESTHGYVADDNGGSGQVLISGSDGNGNASIWANTYSASIGRLGNGEVTVAEGGMITTDANLSVTLASSGSSRGTLNIGGKSGDAAVGAGIVQTGRIDFGNGTGTLNFNHTDEIDFSVALNSTGAGLHLLSHEAGITTLTGNSTGFTGATNVTGGTLIVGRNGMGSLAASAVTVGSGATLMGTGALGGLTVAAGGLHAPGNSIGTQVVNGPYILQGGSTLEIELNATQSDVVIVNGTVDITGAILKVVAASQQTYAGTTEYIIIDNDGADAVVGTFATMSSNYAFLVPSVVTNGGDGNDVVLTITRNSVGLEDVANTPNQRAVAGALEADWATSPLYGTLMWLTPEQARQAFDALSGELHGSIGTVLANDSRFVRNVIFSRLHQAQSFPSGQPDAPQVASANSPTTVAGRFDAPMMGLGMGSSDNAAQPPRNTSLVFWTQGFGSWGDLDGNGNAASANRRIGGFLSGVDAALDDNWRAGFAVGYSRSDMRVGARLSSAEIDGYHLALYAGGSVGALALRGGGTWTWNDIDTQRSVLFPGFFQQVDASYNGDVGQVFGEMALPLSAGRIAYEPFANIAYVRVSADRFAEQGGDAALIGLGNSQNTGFTTLGLRLAADGGTVIPRASFAWQHAFGDVNPLTGLALGSGAAFGISGVPLARNAALIDAGLDFVIAQEATLGISYNGEIAGDIDDHGIAGRLNWRF